MRIKEFSVTRYGPLLQYGPFLLNNFNLFFGYNEEGKSLLIDAIVRFLFRKQSKIFNNINRVDEEPEGYVYIEVTRGNILKLPENGDVTTLTGLSPREYRDIFIIRNSDLSIPEEESIYRDVQNKLLGLRTERIQKIKKKLLDIGKLTPRGEFQDLKEEKLKTRLLKAKQTIEQINSLQEEYQKDNVEKEEAKLVILTEQIEQIEKTISNYEDARKREIYQKGITALDKLLEARKVLYQLGNYKEGEEEIWKNSERDINKAEKKKAELERKLTLNNSELTSKQEELSRKEHDFLYYVDRKRILDNDISPEIKNYENHSIGFSKEKTVQKTLSFSEIAFFFLFIISIYGFIQSGTNFFKVLLSVSGILTFSLFVGNLLFLRKKWVLSGLQEKIKLMAHKAGFAGKTVEETSINIANFLEEYKKTEEKRNILKDEVLGLEQENARLKDEIQKLTDDISNNRKLIDDIKERTGIQTRDDYSKNIKRKREYEKIFATQNEILKSYFGEGNGTEEEKITYWQQKLNEYAPYKSMAKNVIYSEKQVTTLQSEKNKKINETKRIKKIIEVFYDRLKEIERIVNNEILKTTEGEYLICRNSNDLVVLKNSLKTFIEEKILQKDLTLKVKTIFDEIEKEEEKKVTTLFGEKSPVSFYFNTITGGLYRYATYNAEEKKIQVVMNNGKFLEVKKLSSGAYDQLYLSIRLALGEKLLKGEKGFFIMDDPFVKSDTGRLHKQFNILKKLALAGWQIIYFSAKDEVKTCLQDEIRNKQISYFEI